MIFNNRFSITNKQNTLRTDFNVLNWKGRGYAQQFERSKLVDRNTNAKESIWKD